MADHRNGPLAKALMRATPLRAAAGPSSKSAPRCAVISTFMSATTPVPCRTDGDISLSGSDLMVPEVPDSAADPVPAASAQAQV
jgi:hypothetical protein